MSSCLFFTMLVHATRDVMFRVVRNDKLSNLTWGAHRDVSVYCDMMRCEPSPFGRHSNVDNRTACFVDSQTLLNFDSCLQCETKAGYKESSNPRQALHSISEALGM
jgi:hypothetical protein